MLTFTPHVGDAMNVENFVDNYCPYQPERRNHSLLNSDVGQREAAELMKNEGPYFTVQIIILYSANNTTS